MNRQTVIRHCVLAATLFFSAGCLSTNAPVLDPQIRRSSEEAIQALAESSADAALTHYRRAIRRAWTMNHLEEISRLSYNMAATLNAAKNYPEAQAWLLEARAAAVQAESRTDHIRTLLLNAQVSRKMHNYAAAEEYLRLADGVRKCAKDKPGPGISCKLPGCLTKCFDAKAEKRLLELNLEAQSLVERAELAADMGQTDCAKQFLATADDLVKDTKADRTGIYRVYARVYESVGQFELAGRNYFEEARSLRELQQYRNMADALESAASAFEKAGDPIRATELYHHAARCNFGRGAVRHALHLVQCAKRNADVSGSRALVERVSLLFREIDLEVSGGQLPTAVGNTAEPIPMEPTDSADATQFPSEPAVDDSAPAEYPAEYPVSVPPHPQTPALVPPESPAELPVPIEAPPAGVAPPPEPTGNVGTAELAPKPR